MRRWTVSLVIIVLAVLTAGVRAEDVAGAENQQADKVKRRVIYNDDGSPNYLNSPPEQVLEARLKHCLNSQVDTYVVCVGNGQWPPWGRPLPEGEDRFQLLLDAARKAGMEVFGSLRMNDSAHESVNPKTFARNKLKTTRPDLLLGENNHQVKKYPRDSVMYWMWSALNYEKEEVRAHFLDFIKQMCTKYDWDGFELDFCRHTAYFKLGTAEKNIPLMNDFVRQVRTALDEIGTKRGRPFLLAVRVPDTPGLARRVGLDVETWLKEQLVDIVVAGAGFKPYSASYNQFVDLGHRYGVPVYPCIDMQSVTPDSTGDPDPWNKTKRIRAAASNMLFEGGDGVYLFNLFDTFQVLREIGDPDKLESLDKIYHAEALPLRTWNVLCTEPYRLPTRLVDGIPIPLKIGDDVALQAEKGLVNSMLLRLRVTGLEEEESIAVRVNNEVVNVKPVAREIQTKIGKKTEGGGIWFAGKTSAPPFRRGANLVQVLPSIGCWGNEASKIQDVQLWIDYRDKN